VGVAPRLRRQLTELAAVIRRKLAHVPEAPVVGYVGDKRLLGCGAKRAACPDQALEDYESMEAYIRDGLGITDEEVDRLRSQLLE
jgi:flavoprotein